MHGFCISRNGWTGGGGWDSLQGDIYMVAAMLGCKRTKLGLGGPPLALTAWTGLENTTHLVGVVGVVSGKEACLHSDLV